MKFTNWIDHTMFYISVVIICYISTTIVLPMFEIYDKEIWLYISIMSILFGFLIAVMWENKFGEGINDNPR